MLQKNFPNWLPLDKQRLMLVHNMWARLKCMLVTVLNVLAYLKVLVGYVLFQKKLNGLHQKYATLNLNRHNLSLPK